MTNTRLIGGVEKFSPSSENRPYVGYKVVGIRNPTGTGEVAFFGPHYSKKFYGVSADHSCPKHRWGKSFESCQCGFYAYTDIESAVKHWQKECLGASNLVIVEVVLSGDIVVCRNGYRATRQRITKILFSNCWNCSEPGESLVPHKAGSLVTACGNCVTKYALQGSAVSFDLFVEKASLPKFKRLTVSSAKDISHEAAEFFCLSEKKDDDYLAKLLESKDVFLLSEIAAKLNDGIETIISEKFDEA
jgi:hypothetical protein